jgi:hypothetical protein
MPVKIRLSIFKTRCLSIPHNSFVEKRVVAAAVGNECQAGIRPNYIVEFLIVYVEGFLLQASKVISRGDKYLSRRSDTELALKLLHG